MKRITIISACRSGTNYFCDFLGNSFSTINSNYELFNINRGVNICSVNSNILFPLLDLFGLDHHQQRTQPAHFLLRDPYAVHKSVIASHLPRTDPLHAINTISQVASKLGYTFTSYKIFDGQTSMDKLIEVLKESSLVLILKRNPIDRFISEKKASIEGRYCNHDSSGISVNFNVEEYIKRSNGVKKYLDMVEHICYESSIPHHTIRYEHFHSLSLDRRQLFVKNMLPDVNVPIKTLNESDMCFEKQDRETDYSKKITNYEEVKEFINSELESYGVELEHYVSEVVL